MYGKRTIGMGLNIVLAAKAKSVGASHKVISLKRATKCHFSVAAILREIHSVEI
jgi:hypothetical protein